MSVASRSPRSEVGARAHDVSVVIPGRPHAQGRGRAVRLGRSAVRVIDPPRSREWKSSTRVLMRQARGRRPVIRTAVGVWIEAVFARPLRARTSAYQTWCASRVGDCDNIAKAVLDAGNGVLWLDDAQVAELHVRRVYGASGEPAHVRVSVRDLS